MSRMTTNSRAPSGPGWALRLRLLVGLLAPFWASGCFFNLSKHENFKDWYFGRPGLNGTLGGRTGHDMIDPPRHRFFLHFRLPEVIIQPQGGFFFPPRYDAEWHYLGETDGPMGRQTNWRVYHHHVDRGQARTSLSFIFYDQGVVDTVIPYRIWTSSDQAIWEKSLHSTLFLPFLAVANAFHGVGKAGIYATHDALKTLYIPVALVYFGLREEKPAEPAEPAPAPPPRK